MTNWPFSDLWDGRDAVFLVTAMAENERFVRELARAQTILTPERFDGLRPLVYCKFPYVPPYNDFPCLRQLYTQTRDACGLRAEYRGIVALDLSEWLGHEEENYLRVTFKYLHDHRHTWKVLVVAGRADADHLRRLMRSAAPFLYPKLRQLCLFRDRTVLQQYIASRISITPEAGRVLATVCMEIPAVQDCAVLEQVLTELSAQGHRVHTQLLHDYLQDENSLLALLNGDLPKMPAAGKLIYKEV